MSCRKEGRVFLYPSGESSPEYNVTLNKNSERARGVVQVVGSAWQVQGPEFKSQDHNKKEKWIEKSG
jgi:hypothetical protein